MPFQLLLVLALLLPIAVAAEEPTFDPESTETARETLELLKKQGEEAESWADLQRTIARKRLNACMAAFGNRSFCKCLNEELHWVLDFDSYVRIVTSPGAEPKPQPASAEQRVVNSVFRAREQCIPISSN